MRKYYLASRAMTRKLLLGFVLSCFLYRSKGQGNFSEFTEVPQTPLKLSPTSPVTTDVFNTEPRTTDDLSSDPVPTDFTMTQPSLATPPGMSAQYKRKSSVMLYILVTPETVKMDSVISILYLHVRHALYKNSV